MHLKRVKLILPFLALAWWVAVLTHDDKTSRFSVTSTAVQETFDWNTWIQVKNQLMLVWQIAVIVKYGPAFAMAIPGGGNSTTVIPRSCGNTGESLLNKQDYETQETAFFRSIVNEQSCHESPNLVVDVGANLGWFSSLALNAGCRVIAVEPDEVNVKSFTMTSRLNGWRDRLSLLHGFAGADENPADKRFRLDHHVKEDVLFVKIDVEGHEPDVIEGLSEMLKNYRVHAWLIEYNAFAHADPSLKYLQWLIGKGYVVLDETNLQKQITSSNFMHYHDEVASKRRPCPCNIFAITTDIYEALIENA